MWKRKKTEEGDLNKVPNPVTVAIIIAVVSLTVSAGVARWSWLLLDEQLELRKELNALDMRQAQVETQYEFWLGQIQEDIDALK